MRGRPANPRGSRPGVAAVIEDVVARYGTLSAEELSRISHRETPWREARAGLPSTARSNRIIDRDVMRAHYGALLHDPERALDDVIASAVLEGASEKDLDVEYLRSLVPSGSAPERGARDG